MFKDIPSLSESEVSLLKAASKLEACKLSCESIEVGYGEFLNVHVLSSLCAYECSMVLWFSMIFTLICDPSSFAIATSQRFVVTALYPHVTGKWYVGDPLELGSSLHH